MTLTVLATFAVTSPASADENVADWAAVKNVSSELRAAIDDPGKSNFAGPVKLKSDATLELGTDGPTMGTAVPGKSKLKGRSASGAALYDTGESTSTVVLDRDNGDAAQILVVIKSSDAPETFDFKVGRGRAETTDEGVTTIKSGKDTWVLAPAWAKDAAGTSVPTHYEVRGNTITQVVTHSGMNYKYPIVADPFLGKAIFKNVYRDLYRSDYRYNGDLTTWGKTIYTLPASQALWAV